jgi:1,4-alpha-glucan branching enzyme
VRDLLVTLNAQADSWPAVWERDHDETGFQWLDADNDHLSIFAFLRWAHAGAHAVACLANFTPVPRGGYRIGLPWPGSWQVVVDTDATRFGGGGSLGDRVVVEATGDVPWQGQPASAVLDVPPLGVVWLAAHRP